MGLLAGVTAGQHRTGKLFQHVDLAAGLIGPDTVGSLLDGLVALGDIQDRDGAPDLTERCPDAYLSLSRLFADGGYTGQKLEVAIAHLDCLAVEIIKRSDAHCFVVLPRRWVVERTIASSEAWLIIASIRRMTRRLAKVEL